MPDVQTTSATELPVDSTIEQLEAEITTLGAHLNAGTYRFLALIGEFDRREGWGGWGIRSCAHWLNWKCGIGLGAAREQLRVAGALQGLPAISAAMRAGRLSYTKVRAMTRIATAENERALLSIAENGTASHIETVVRHYRRTGRAEELQRDAERHQRRSFRYYWDHDGSLVIEGRLPPEQGALVIQALKAADQLLREASTDPAVPRGPTALAPAVAAAPAVHCASGAASGSACESAAQSELPASVCLADLDPEQQEALERLQVAAQQWPQRLDASARADADQPDLAPAHAPPDVSAETSS